MELKEYQDLSNRTVPDDLVDMLGMGILGCCGEAGELAELLKKARYQGHDLNIGEVIDELGDLLWYVARVADAVYASLDAVAEQNLNKLWERYPHGFTPDASRDREPA
jgi:NTP pyrophosphatase (non-canonical NTP hydrolase)